MSKGFAVRRSSDEAFRGAETNGRAWGFSFGLSTTVWGFNSGDSIDDCEYPQVKESNKCPEGDLPTRDTHLRPLAPGLTGVFAGL